MDIAEIVLRWKEFGAVGVAIVLIYKLLDKAFAWLLEVLGIKIKRGQAREDEEGSELKLLRADMDKVKEEIAVMKSALRTTYRVTQNAANGIEKELRILGYELPTVQFFVDQLRTIQPLEEILKD